MMMPRLVEPIIFILAGLLIGLGTEQLLQLRVRKYGSLTGWRIDSILVSSLRGMPLIWSTLAGIYVGVMVAHLSTESSSFLMRLLHIPLILSITLMTVRLSTGLIGLHNERRGKSGTTVSLARSLTTAIIALIGVLIILQSLGISVTPALAALGITGLAVSLALEETLSNVFSGVYIILSRQNQPGDYVRLKIDERDHVEGYITDITWRSTKIRMMPSRMRVDTEPSIVNVPNSRMASDIVVTHHRRHNEQEIAVQVAVCAGNDLERVEKVTLDVARAVLREIAGVDLDTGPMVRYRTFTTTSIEFTVVMYANETVDQHLLRHRFIKRLYQRLQKEGVAVVLAQNTAKSE